MGAIGYSCPIRLVPTYILPTIEIRILGRFHPESFKTERLVCVESDKRTCLTKNTFTLWGRQRLLRRVANF